MATPAPPPRHPWHWRVSTLAPGIGPALQRRLAISVLVAAALVALFALVGFFAVPPIAKWKIETLADSELGRHATVGKVRFNPFTLRARVSDFRLAGRDPGRTLLRFDTLDVDLSTESLWKRALVLDAVRLVRPRVEIARNAAGEYDIQDLIDRAMAPSKGPASTSDFAVDNIEIEDGSVVLDDAVHRRRIAVTQLSMGIPFLSSRSHDAQIRVRPHLQGSIDGTPFAFIGSASSPFEKMRQATLAINLDALSLPRYVGYAPLPNGLKLTGGALTTRLLLAFVSWNGSARGITLTGNARLDGLAVARKDGSRFAAVRSVDVALGKLDLLGRTVAIDRISVASPEVDLRRLPDGTLEVQRLLTRAPAGGTTAGGTTASAAAAPWKWSVDEASVSGGAVRVVDEAVAPAFDARLSDVTITGAKLASQGAPGTVDATFDSAEGAHFAVHSTVDIAGDAAAGHFAVTKLPLAKLRPYYEGMLAIDVRRGALDLAADFDAGAGAPVRFTMAQGSAAIANLDVAIRGEREPLGRMASVNADGVALDLATRTLTVGNIEARRGTLRLLRDANGRMHYERVLRVGQGQAADEGARVAGPNWHVAVHRVLLEGLGVDFEDRVPAPAVKLRVADAKVVAENLDTERGAKATIDLAARVGSKGRVRAHGVVSAQPVSADLRIDATTFDLVPLRPYLESRTHVVVTSGAMNAKGRLTYTDAGAAGPLARYVGDIAVSDFGSLDRPGSRELVRWKRLALTGVDLNSAPFKVAINAVALDQLYARLILTADAKLNVLQLLASDAPAGAQAQAAAPAGERQEIPASIGRVQLSSGEVEFSDFFVKPNYSVHLTDLNGNVSALGGGGKGAVELTARVEGSAPVDIRGTVKPFARELALDITGKATGVDLPPLTPYSIKYAGYNIQKGKLSMEVHYKLDDRKLTASNKLVLDQLTFGERVDSPTATKLPVLFILALLKDRNGVINLELPISGTLDDPKFSLWGVVVHVVGSLFTKAATAPFALLGAVVGGGEQLAYVEFAPGRAVLTPAAQAKLAALAKALVERPGLKLDAAGRAVPDVDGDGLRRAKLDHALRLRKQKDLAAAGKSAPALEDLAIDAADYAKYLKDVYRDTSLPNKPRNFIGIAKDIPAAQMETLLLASYRVDENALRELANRRAQVVKDWLVSKGHIPAERVFIAAPRLGAEGLKAGAAPTRVDFAIR